MAIYHCSIKTISRGKGQSAIAAAAYRAGEKITSEYDGRTSDYTRKGGIVHTEIILPENAPAEYQDRAVLWNAVEKIEKAKNSQLAREIQLALPVELSYMQNINLVREYVKKNFTDKGMCADIAIHDNKDGNPHAHIMLTMRPLNEDKTWGDKQKKVYEFDKDGNKIYDPKKRQYKCSKVQTTDWNEQTKAEEWRAAWADTANRYLEELNHPSRIDHRSNARQGKEKIPTIHLGVAAHQMEQRGIQTERGNINRAIELANAEIEKINATLLVLEMELEQLKADELQQQETPPAATPKQSNPVAVKVETDTPKPPKTATDQTVATKSTTAKSDTTPTPKPKPKTYPTPAPKPVVKPMPKPRTLQQVDLELSIIESKLSRLEHASKVIMSYDHKIQDIERNLSSAGFFERRKMNKEIANQERKRSDYQKDTTKKYGTTWQLESEKSKLLKEKTQIENATGVTAAREAEQQRKRDAVIQQQQDRDRYNAERRAKRLENPSRDKNSPSL